MLLQPNFSQCIERKTALIHVPAAAAATTYISIVKQTFSVATLQCLDPIEQQQQQQQKGKVRFYARASHISQHTLFQHLVPPSHTLVLLPLSELLLLCSAPRQILLFPTCRYCIFALNIFEMLLRSVNEINASG